MTFREYLLTYPDCEIDRDVTPFRGFIKQGYGRGLGWCSRIALQTETTPQLEGRTALGTPGRPLVNVVGFHEKSLTQ